MCSFFKILLKFISKSVYHFFALACLPRINLNTVLQWHLRWLLMWGGVTSLPAPFGFRFSNLHLCCQCFVFHNIHIQVNQVSSVKWNTWDILFVTTSTVLYVHRQKMWFFHSDVLTYSHHFYTYNCVTLTVIFHCVFFEVLFWLVLINVLSDFSKCWLSSHYP